MENLAPITFFVGCLIVALYFSRKISRLAVDYFTRSSTKKGNRASIAISWFSEPTAAMEKEQIEDSKTEEESNPSPKSSGVSEPDVNDEDEEEDEDGIYWREKHENSKKLFQEALVIQDSSWTCAKCTFYNSGSKVNCEMCGDRNGRVRRV